MKSADTLRAAASGRGAVPPLLVASLLIGTMLNPINSSLIATALTPIGRALHVSSAQTAWLVACLYLVAAVAQPLMGRLADLFGPRRVFQFGLSVALLGGLVGGLAPSLPWLIVSRMLIGLGTSAGYPCAITLLRRHAEQSGQPTPPTTLAAITVANQITAIVGPTLGGLLVGSVGWRAVFLVNVPVTLLGLGLAFMHLPRDGRPAAFRTLGQTLDLPGVGLFSVALTSLMLFLMQLHPVPLYGWLGLSVVAFAALYAVERRTPAAFLDVRMLAGNRPLLQTYLRQALTALITYSIFYGLPQWLQEARSFTPTQTGLLLLPTSAVSIVCALLVARLPQLRLRALLVIGAALQLVCMVLYAAVPQVASLWLLVGVSLLLGIPWGLTNFANQQMLYAQAPREGAGSAAGLFRTFNYLGSIASSSVIGFTFRPSATNAGFQSLTWVLVVTSVLTLLVTLLRDPVTVPQSDSL
ncbi:MFS transporter (plasmid) [Deinococcus sp. KNUC1210]|uniref:MFS transporter n=1 Tax=Deinococcus sp. KNUC1210 TaxID=2917691 RepID=UPI001EF12CEB|nr:MFS transporter [Deinococcus sp. KNUC1210]ULH17469.1 MFS transporter [Deinococcus sp. KNUC1210]